MSTPDVLSPGAAVYEKVLALRSLADNMRGEQ